MRLQRVVAALLAPALMVATLPSSHVFAQDETQGRWLEDSASFSMAVEAIMNAEGNKTGSTWKNLDAASKKVVENHIQWMKKSREALADEMRSELDRYSGRDHACERAEIERQKEEVDAGLKRILKQLRHVRGDRRKDFTKLHRFMQNNAIRPLGKLARKALKMSLPDLVAMAVDGGLSRMAMGQVLRRNAVRVVRNEGRSLLRRTLDRELRRGRLRTGEDALAKVCGSRVKASPAPPDGQGSIGTNTVASDAACEGWTPELPAPPFEEYAIVIRMDWEGSDKYDYRYYATTAEDPINDPRAFALSPGSFASWSGGCTPEATTCSRLDPLILTEARLDELYERDGTPLPHNTHAAVPGSYTLAAHPGGLCLYEDDPGVISHYERLAQDRAAAPEAVELTATIEYYEKGAKTPHQTESRSAVVPLSLGDGEVGWDDPQHRRAFGDPIVLPASGETAESD